MEYPPSLIRLVEEQPYPFVFVTISGAHLYGFPSPDSDYDLRGLHVLPVSEVVQLDPGRETIEVSGIRDRLEMDLVSHDVRKFFLMMLKKNGYVLEQLYSPLIIRTTPEHQELKQIGHGCVTRHHAHHYIGFADTQWRLFEKENPRRVKPLLYVYRVLLTGIDLMHTGEVEANLQKLNEQARLSHVSDLIARKLAGPEQSELTDSDFDFHRREYERLLAHLQEVYEKKLFARSTLCKKRPERLVDSPPQVQFVNINLQKKEAPDSHPGLRSLNELLFAAISSCVHRGNLTREGCLQQRTYSQIRSQITSIS